MSAAGVVTEQTKTLLAMAKRPEGVTVDDLPAGVHQRALWRLAARGRLFTITSGTRAFKRHYFDSQERADAYYAANPNPQWVPKRTVQTSKQQQYKPGKPITIVKATEAPVRIASRAPGGPARQPGEPVITANTKITIAPPPPERVYRTNTYTVSP